MLKRQMTNCQSRSHEPDFPPAHVSVAREKSVLAFGFWDLEFSLA
jgi:hypothetical protein